MNPDKHNSDPEHTEYAYSGVVNSSSEKTHKIWINHKVYWPKVYLSKVYVKGVRLIGTGIRWEKVTNTIKFMSLDEICNIPIYCTVTYEIVVCD